MVDIGVALFDTAIPDTSGHLRFDETLESCQFSHVLELSIRLGDETLSPGVKIVDIGGFLF